MADISGLTPTQKIARGESNEQAREDWVNNTEGTVTTPAGTTLKPLKVIQDEIEAAAATAASTLRSELVALYEPIVYATTAAMTAALSGLDVGQAVIDEEAGAFGFVVDDSGNTFQPVLTAADFAQLAVSQFASIDPADVGGTANAITLTTGYSLGSTPETIAFEPAASNTGAVTIAVDGNTAADLLSSSGDALSAGDLVEGQVYLCKLDANGDYRLATGGGAGIGPSFNDRLSTGDRTASLKLNATGFTAGFNGNLINGDTDADDAGGRRINSGTAATAISVTIPMPGLLPRVLKAIRHKQSSTATAGTFLVEGSNDNGASYTTIKSGIAIGGATEQLIDLENSTAYSLYRVRGTSGTASATVWWTEWEFNIGVTVDVLTDGFEAARAEYHGANSRRVARMQDELARAAQSSMPPIDYVPQKFILGSAGAVLTTTADAGGNKRTALNNVVIGDGSFVYYPSMSSTAYDPAGVYHLEIIPVDPERTDDIQIDIMLNASVTRNDSLVVDRGTFGIVRASFRNENGGVANSSFYPRITNNGATDIEILPPRFATTDLSAFPDFRRAFYATDVPLWQPEVRRFDWWSNPGFWEDRWDHLARSADYCVDAVNGDDATGDGSRFNRWASLSEIPTLTDGKVVSFSRGSVFREQLGSYWGQDVHVAFVGDNFGALRVGNNPTISAWQSIDDADISAVGDGTYTFTFTGDASSLPTLDSALNNGYNRIGLRRRNAALDAAGKPVAAGATFKWVSATGSLSEEGTVYAAYATGTWTVTFRPFASETPKDGSHTYEVTDFAGSILHAAGNLPEKGCIFANLNFDGAVAGYGMISSGFGTLIDRATFLGGDTHDAVIGSFKMTRSAILKQGDTSDSIVVAYSDQDTSDQVTHYENVFNISQGAFYAHNAGGESEAAKALIVTGSHIRSQRDPDTNALVGGLGAADQTYVSIYRQNYVNGAEKVSMRFATTYTPEIVYEENLVRNVAFVTPSTRNHNNIYVGSNWGDTAIAANRGHTACRFANDGNFTNNLCILTHDPAELVSGNASDSRATIYVDTPAGGPTTDAATVRRNIFVVYVPSADQFNLATITSSLARFDIDENIYIFVSDTPLAYGTPGQSYGEPTNKRALGQWVANTGYDANSLFLDLRGHPLGINAVFRDFANGDLRWAATDAARQVQAFNARRIANGDLPIGPSWTIDEWPYEPTPDEIFQMINRGAPMMGTSLGSY
ncbi:hypothetical protein KUV46_15630 [Thalassovita mediterranea]|nr:hypothetical protein KUV46_15630 [Thalassovita mediterranea]